MRALIYVIFIIYSRCMFAADTKEEAVTAPAADNNQPLQASNVKKLSASFPSFADVVSPLMPAVVNVYTVQSKKVEKNNKGNNLPENFPFEHFNELFEQFNLPLPFNFEESYSNPKSVALGSGFIIDPSGLIVTNHHVVGSDDEFNVKLMDNTELKAKLIGSDPRTDLALIKVEAKSPLPFVQFGDSAKVRVGDWAIAIGNPFGLGGTVTAGIVSSKGRDIDMNNSVDDFIQTDAAINKGNSGGPMFNVDGEVIGVNTAIFSPSGTNIGIGFAIPSNTAKKIVEQLKATGKVSRGRLDVTIQEITPEIAEGLGLKDQEGALIVEVVKDGAADKAGIKSGDIITEFAGQPIKNSRKLQIMVAETAINQDIKISVIRSGKQHNFTVRISDTEKDNKQSKSTLSQDAIGKKHIERNNITFSNLTEDLRQKFGFNNNTHGVVITTIGHAAKHPILLKPGDLVVSINQHEVNNVDDLAKIFDQSKTSKHKHVILLIKRGGASIFLAMPIQ